MNRRDFLKYSIQGATVISLAPLQACTSDDALVGEGELVTDQSPFELLAESGERGARFELDAMGHSLSFRGEAGAWSYDRAGTTAKALNYPTDALYDEERGELYVANSGNANVLVFDAHSGEVLRVIGGERKSPDALQSVQGIALGPAGVLYVADGLAHTIRLLDRRGKALGRVGAFGMDDQGLNGPAALCLDGDLNLHIADRGNRRVQIFSRAGRWQRSYAKDTTPRAMASDKNGRIFVADAVACAVLVFDASGKLLHEEIPTDSSGRQIVPMQLSRQPDGRVYVVGRVMS